MEKPETALGIYKYGMKNVPVSDKNFKVCDVILSCLPVRLEAVLPLST
jgi:hypothetical protein